MTREVADGTRRPVRFRKLKTARNVGRGHGAEKINAGGKQVFDMEAAAPEFDQLKEVDEYWSNREYYHGWSQGEDVVLVYRDDRGKRCKEIVKFDWYFWIRHEDKCKLPEDGWDYAQRKGWIKRLVRDARFPNYWRIYVTRWSREFNRRRVFQKRRDPNFTGNWVLDWVVGERPSPIRFPERRDRWLPWHHIINWLQRKGVEPLEADLSPKQRFLTDHDIKIKPKFRFMYVDIETDDTSGGFENKEDNRILSIAWEGDGYDSDPSDSGFLYLEEDTDKAEQRMLRKFCQAIKDYEVLVAWNGVEFDFPVLLWRCEIHRLKTDWRLWLFVDLLPIFKRHYVRAGSEGTSFRLDFIGEKVLGLNKIDWRSIFRARHPGVTPTFRNLWKYDKQLLEEYNRYDCRIARKLEEFTGFAFVEMTFCRIANGFPNDFQISTKVDQLLLKKALKEGHHFPSRYARGIRPDKYYGAYVFDPKVGMHRNVGSFDFKSLYPSMVRAFNISPETLVKQQHRQEFDEKDLCRVPEVEIDGVTQGGSTFRTDRHGYISQMFVNTLERRKKYTELQKKRLDEVGTTQDDLYLLYYRLAYSFKRLGLSFYGDLGNPNGRYYDTELAQSITLAGQFFIKLTAKFAEEWGFAPLYGDTDSVYLQLAPDDRQWSSEDARIEDLNATGAKFVAYCQKRYVEVLQSHNCKLDWNVIELEFEDVFDRIFFVKKKRYAGRMLAKKGSATNDVEVKGLEVMRSDVAESARELQQRALDAILMKQWPAERVLNDLIEPEFDRCLNGHLPVEQLSIGKGISKDPAVYKVRPLHVRLAEDIKAHGREFFIGMKVEYVVTGSSGGPLAGVTREDYEAGGYEYDPEYYWDRVIYPATLRILEVVYPDIHWQRYLVRHKRKRDKLLERYKRWFLHPKKVRKAFDQIKAHKRTGVLGEPELANLKACIA